MKKKTKAILGIASVLLVGGALTDTDDKAPGGAEKAEQIEVQESAEEVQEEVKTERELLEADIENVLNKNDEFEISEHYEDGYMVRIKAKVTNRGTAEMYAARVIEEVFELDYRIREVTVTGTREMRDKYGEEKEMDMYRVSVTDEVNEKINWDNFYAHNFESVAEVWVNVNWR